MGREAEKKIAQQVQGEKKITKTKEEKKERKERADEILQELSRVTSSHPAHEILQGVEIDKKTITDHPELGNLLLDIVHTVNSDPNKYHDPKWLQDKIRRINGFVSSLGASPEAQKLQDIEKNVENLYKQSQKNRRENEVDEEVEKIKRGEQAQDAQRPQRNGEQEYEHLTDWVSAASDIKDDEIKAKFSAASTAIEATRNDPKKQQDAYMDLYGEYIEMKRKIIKQIKPGNENAIKTYQQLQKTMEAVARQYTDKFPKEEKQVRDAERYPDFVMNEKRIQSDADYREYWFYHILENLLYNKKTETSRELYSLYEMGEMHKFLEVVRRMPESDGSGKSIGIKLATKYDILKNTIFQSHDMDYYCAHPQQDMKEFIGSTSMFLNDYYDAAVQDPMVTMAKRLYEEALFSIRDSHGGYLPREYLMYTEAKLRASKLDEMVERNLKQAIEAGQLYNVLIDPITGMPVPSDWNRKQIDFDPNNPKPYTLNDLYGNEPEQSDSWKRSLGELKIQAALKQAKGLSLVDQRLLEIIGKSKGTGTKYESNGQDWGANAFNSVPYEGIVRYLDPVIHYYGRFNVGMDISNAFFNMMVSDSSKYKWDPKHMQKLIPMYLDGKFKEAKDYAAANNLGDIGTRLSAMDNPFGYSGMWGTMTKWRVADATAGFDDWEKDRAYAAAVKLTNIGDVFSAPDRNSSFQKYGSTWAFKKAKRYFIEVANKDEYERCRTEFRNYYKDSDDPRYREMAQNDEQKRGANTKNFDPEFEFLWRTQGEKRYSEKLDKLWKAQMDPKTGHPPGHALKNSELARLTKRLERAYKARVWVQTAVKAPLIIARQLEVEVAKHGEELKKGPLRKKIIWDILGIDMDDLELLGGDRNLTPTTDQEAKFDRIADVEGALGSIQQAAIRENRELVDKDFDDVIEKLTDTAKKQNFIYAKEYWHKVKRAMLGDKSAADYYDALGIKDADKDLKRGLRFHDINWDKINEIDIDDKYINSPGHFIVNGFGTELLNNELIDRNWRHLFSTEDMGWEFLNINALGSRNPVRRAGDLGSHVQFGQLFEKYLTDYVQRPVGNVDKMVEALHEMFAAMSGDFQDVAAEACARVAYSTGMIYKQADWAWQLPVGIGQIGSLFKATSISQEIHGRDRGIAWGPNDMLQWVQAVGSHILPKARYSKFTGEETMPNSEWDRAKLSKYLNGTKANATYEILNMTIMIATLITLYRAFTAKSEEEEE